MTLVVHGRSVIECSVRDHQAHSMSQQTGRAQEAAKPDPRVKDPMDGSEINGNPLQALEEALRKGEDIITQRNAEVARNINARAVKWGWSKERRRTPSGGSSGDGT